jgi:preprotein translocase subunit SecE
MDLKPSEWVGVSRQFFGDVRTEFGKVTWPPQKEAVAGTIGVIVIVAVMTVVMWVVDVLCGWLIQSALP